MIGPADANARHVMLHAWRTGLSDLTQLTWLCVCWFMTGEATAAAVAWSASEQYMKINFTRHVIITYRR
jgi:hypothetical protein